MGKIKAIHDKGNLDSAQIAQISGGTEISKGLLNQGTFHGPIVEALPKFIQSKSEKVVDNGNSWIVLGRDRPRSLASGAGGAGKTQASSIDLVVGRMGYNPTSNAWVDPNFKTDAARIHISQRTNIDENFNLCKGTVGSPKSKSGIGIKADGVRMMGREGIKLVTSTDTIISRGTKKESVGNIDLIAGNDDTKLEPLVKGNKLIAALEALVKQVDDVTENLNSFVTFQMGYNASIAAHTHPVICMGGGSAVPSPTLAAAGAQMGINIGSTTGPTCVISKINNAVSELKFLNHTSEDYILSRNVNTT